MLETGTNSVGVGAGGGSLGKLPHSHSTPAGVDGTPAGARTPPTTPKRAGKMLAIRVHMLDDSVTMFQIQAKALGRVLFDQVCKQLHLLEADYFGLEYQEPSGTRYWLDLEKPLSRQLGLSLVDTLLRFCVKFYTPDPAQLEEEFTRYLFSLQVKRDLAHGRTQCNDNTAALMASYIVQAECGDYVAEDYPDPTSYLSCYKFVPHQDRELERRIMENHKKHTGQSPAEADLNLLETARRCELYGIKMHPAKDHEGVPLNLSVAHMGIVVFQNYTKINTFSWAKIRKISFKRKRFLIKLHPEGYGYYKDTVEFFFEGRNECKNFWKKCVENHGFFRCSAVKRAPRQRARVLSRGSSFRYSGKTQKQIVEFVRENYVKRTTFQRSQSFRHSGSVHSSQATNVGGSISAHPLIPLGENSIVSVSCGSMRVTATPPESPRPGASPTTRRRATPTTAMVGVVGGDGTITPTSTLSPAESLRSQGVENGVTPPTPPPKIVATPEGARKNSSLRQENNNVIVALVSSTPNNKTANGAPYSSLNLSSDICTSPDLSPMKSIKDHHQALNSSTPNNIADGEVKKKRNTADRAYFISKEILMTERTFRKDLEVINLWLRDEVSSKDEGEGGVSCSEPCLDLLLNLMDPLHDVHCNLLRDIELRLAAWETSTARIADILNQAMDHLHLYDDYLSQHLYVLEQLDAAFRANTAFETLYRDFEAQKVCYLPLTAFVLKPLHRLLHYAQLIDRLLNHYAGPKHPDYEDCVEAKSKLVRATHDLPRILYQSENYAHLCELQRDTAGCDTLVSPHRQFLRQGCLSKFSQRRGYQQRMFFLFSDMLLYTNRVGHVFRVHGQLPLRGLQIEERADTPPQHSFVIYGGNRVLTVAASSEQEKDKWLEELSAAIQASKEAAPQDTTLTYFSLKSCSSSDEGMEKCGGGEEMNGGTAGERVSLQRSNTTVHVCWHRNTSISIDDQLRAVQNQLSGYLLRKFKNSNGWQKLWVVFTNFCLFFYKTFQDDAPLASLPLLGYTASAPSDKDAIHKDYVLKLQFKNHVYFFRAESEYTYNRWMEVITSATQHSGRIRLFSRKESALLDSTLPPT